MDGFVVPHTHLDVGYTYYQGNVAERQSRVITQAADLIRQDPDFRFSIDGSWGLEQFLAARSVEKREGILKLVRQGMIALPAQCCSVWNEKLPFWWEGHDGKMVLFWYSRHDMQVQSRFGMPPRLAAVRDSILVYLRAYSRSKYKLDAVLIYGTRVEKSDLFQ